MSENRIVEILDILENEYENWNVPVKKFIKNSGQSPFQMLVSIVLSSRTKDEITSSVCERLFEKIHSPEDVIYYKDEIESMIYPVGFYRNKAKKLVEMATILIERYNSCVPDKLEDLLKLPGVGRKTANLFLQRVFGIESIAVDTHVHRISNRLGVVRTKTPFETEKQLLAILPAGYRSRINKLFVAFGQAICKPVSPQCRKCPVEKLCQKVGV
jgi:endonuclease-3